MFLSFTLRRLAAMLIVCLAVWASSSAWAARPAASRLLPDNTVAVITVPNVPDLAERFMNTALGKMSQDAQMKPLVAHLYGSLSDAVTEVQERVALSLPEMLALPQGELTAALIAPKEGQPAVVVIIEAKEQIANARRLLEKGTAAVEKAEAQKSEEEVGGVKLTTYQMQGSRLRRAGYFEKDGLVVLGTDPDVLRQMIKVLGGEKAEALADNFSYNAIMNRCRGEKETAPQVLWFVDPIGIMKAFGKDNAGMTIALAMLPSLGLDGLSGLGGTLAFDAGAFDTISRTHILLESPRKGVLKMIALQPVDAGAEKWIPTDIGSYTSGKWDVESSFKTLASLYDSFRGPGALSKEMSNRILGPTGIDLEKDILPHLDGRITLLTRIVKPVTLMSQQQMLALRLKESEPIEKALQSLSEKFSERLIAKEFAGKKYYRIEIPSPPPREGAEPQPMPEPCFAVVDGYLMLTDRQGLIEKVILTLSEGKSLSDELDFKLMTGRIKRQAGDTKPAMISFNRPEEGMRYLYDLALSERVRQGLKRRAERNGFFKSLDSAMEQNPLPPFAVIEKYLAPQGALLVDDETGLHYTSFTLKRKN